MAIQNNVFEQTEHLVETIGIDIKTDGKLKGFVLNKMFGKGKDYVASLLPYGKQVIEVVTLISKTDPPQAPQLEAAEKAAIRGRILTNIEEEYEYSDKISRYLLAWGKALYEDKSIDFKDKVVLMRGMREWLLKSIGSSKAEEFKKMIKKWRLEAVKELFATANVEIYQVCESNEFGEIFNDKVYATKFSNNKKDNQKILLGLIDVGLTVSASAISTEELNEYFPTCKIVFEAREIKPLDEQMEDNYMNESPSSTFAKAMAKRRLKEDLARKERLEELKRIKNKKYIEVY